MTELRNRRRFLGDIGRGTLVATLGPVMASELGIATKAFAEGEAPALKFGELEPLVRLMQDTPVEKLQVALAAKVAAGESLKRLVAAGTLANARSFGGEDYIGFHTMMALSPALQMAGSMPEKQKALPVFKVLYRNTGRIQENGGHAAEVLHPVEGGGSNATPERLLAAVRGKDRNQAEQLFASMVAKDGQEAFDALLGCVQENLEVHRTVLPYRAWDLLDVVGQEHAHTLLRQSLRYCLEAESGRQKEWDEHGKVLTSLLDEHKLLGRSPGSRNAADGFIVELMDTVFKGTPAEAAGAAAAALAQGFDPNDIGEAISLAANQLLLRDRGRPPEWEFPGKPVGSVHGDSIGVHAADSIHAWRNLARVSQGRNQFACIILAAWQVARDRGTPLRDFLKWEPIPHKRHIGAVRTLDQAKMLAELDEAVRGRLQTRAGAIVHRYGEQGHAPEAVFQVLLRYAVSEDGALHAEKFYKTAWDEFHRTRPAFRWRHVVALARVTASEYGNPAPGQEEAREILGVELT